MKRNRKFKMSVGKAAAWTLAVTIGMANLSGTAIATTADDSVSKNDLEDETIDSDMGQEDETIDFDMGQEDVLDGSFESVEEELDNLARDQGSNSVAALEESVRGDLAKITESMNRGERDVADGASIVRSKLYNVNASLDKVDTCSVNFDADFEVAQNRVDEGTDLETVKTELMTEYKDSIESYKGAKDAYASAKENLEAAKKAYNEAYAAAQSAYLISLDDLAKAQAKLDAAGTVNELPDCAEKLDKLKIAVNEKRSILASYELNCPGSEVLGDVKAELEKAQTRCDSLDVKIQAVEKAYKLFIESLKCLKPPVVCPPVVCPPVVCPPVVCPPVVCPPGEYPPVVCPPAVCPPVVIVPPGVLPPIVCPPIVCPPGEKPPVVIIPPEIKPPVVKPPEDDNPGDDNPGGDNPGDDNPGGDKPGDDNPGGDKPGDDNPGGDKPGVEDPDVKPPVINPGDDNPGGDKPGVEDPDVKPPVINPGDDNPGGNDPGVEDPEEKPPVINPGDEDSSNPPGVNPGNDNPSGNSDGDKTNKAPDKTPKTGDSMNLGGWISLLFVGLAGSLGTIRLRRRKEEK